MTLSAAYKEALARSQRGHDTAEDAARFMRSAFRRNCIEWACDSYQNAARFPRGSDANTAFLRQARRAEAAAGLRAGSLRRGERR